MTNKEFYGDKLLAVILNHVCNDLQENLFGKFCDNKNCLKCEFKDAGTIENWLNAEHKEPEPPLLENGDRLQPGDWIMVRDDEESEWFKMPFVFYYNNLFFVVDNLSSSAIHENGINVTGWQQARLPMDGE